MTDGRKKNSHTYILGKLHEANIVEHKLEEKTPRGRKLSKCSRPSFIVNTNPGFKKPQVTGKRVI